MHKEKETDIYKIKAAESNQFNAPCESKLV